MKKHNSITPNKRKIDTHDLYGGENRRLFREIINLIEKMFLERCNSPEFDQSHVPNEDFDPEPWCRYVRRLGASMIEETGIDGDIYHVCLWDGSKARPANKDNYDSYLVLNPNIGPPYIVVPNELAIRIIALGFLP
jgi:hypothetical protein